MAYCPLRPYMLCPLSSDNMNSFEMEPTEEKQAGFSFIRFLHTSPNAPALDIYLDDRKAVSNLLYASMAGYTALPSASHNFEIYPIGQKDKTMLRFTIKPDHDSYYTIALGGSFPNIQYRIYRDAKEVIPDNESCLRFVHAAPGAPSFDVTVETGEKLFSSITFGRTEEYATLEPQIYNFRVRAAGTPNVMLGLQDITLAGGRAYTIYAIGMFGGSPPFTAIILSDGKR